jgi:hypothetical protein
MSKNDIRQAGTTEFNGFDSAQKDQIRKILERYGDRHLNAWSDGASDLDEEMLPQFLDRAVAEIEGLFLIAVKYVDIKENC